jgi:tRNA-dihydrouridine synthase
MSKRGLNTTAERMLKAYAAEENEQWRADYHDAMACRDLEDTIELGNGVYRSIAEISDRRRGSTQRGEDLGEIERYFRCWLRPCDRILARIAKFETEFKDGVEGAAEFRANCKKAKAFLEHEEQVAAVERRIGLRDLTLNSRAADALERILIDPTPAACLSTYVVRSVPLADPSILKQRQ